MSSHLSPRASLLGIPAELRLEIYAQLAKSTHTHNVYPSEQACYRSPDQYIQYLCPYADPHYPQLCTRPRFSGLHLTQDLCKPPTNGAQHNFAVRRTCRLIYAESQGLFDAPATSVSVFAKRGEWIFYLRTGAALQAIRHITLMEVPYNLTYINEVILSLRRYALDLTGLQSIAVQSPVAHRRFAVQRRKQGALFSPETRWQDLKIVKMLDEIFGTRVMIVLDAWACFRPGHRFYEGSGIRDEMVVVRGVLWPGEGERKTSCEVVRREDVVEVSTVEGVEKGDEEQWKKYWMDKGLVYGPMGN